MDGIISITGRKTDQMAANKGNGKRAQEESLMGLEIIFEYSEERDHNEYFMKGYRRDIIVQTESGRYRLCMMSLKRLKQEYESSVSSSECYITDPNTVLVRNVTPEEIVYTIHRLYERGYFDKLDHYGFGSSSIRRKKWR